MAQWQNLLERVLGGHADHNIRFSVLRGLLRRLGFDERIRGDHHIFTRAGVREILDLQPEHGGKAKSYQVRQVRDILRKYGLTQVP